MEGPQTAKVFENNSGNGRSRGGNGGSRGGGNSGSYRSDKVNVVNLMAQMMKANQEMMKTNQELEKLRLKKDCAQIELQHDQLRANQAGPSTPRPNAGQSTHHEKKQYENVDLTGAGAPEQVIERVVDFFRCDTKCHIKGFKFKRGFKINVEALKQKLKELRSGKNIVVSFKGEDVMLVQFKKAQPKETLVGAPEETDNQTVIVVAEED